MRARFVTPVHSLKYRNLRAMAPVLAGLLADFVVSQSIEADLLVPAPLHPKRERSRGYNQSLLLARETGALLNMETSSDALRRVQNTPSQASVSSEEERWGNVANAFQAAPDLVGGKRVIILDDVCTTGATLEACSLALKAAGALSAQGLTLAREVRTGQCRWSGQPQVCLSNQLSCSPILRPSMGTETLTPSCCRAGSKNCLYRWPARKPSPPASSRCGSSCDSTSFAHRRRSRTPIVLSVKSYGVMGW